MPRPVPLSAAAAALIAAAALAALYAGPLTTSFLNDDHLFLERARTVPLAAAIAAPDPLGNYWRPLSRAVYFALLAPPAGGSPGVFHAVNFALFLGALVLLHQWLRGHASRAGAMAGVAFFALLPFQRVNLTWISCAQDLLALLFTLAAFALWRSGRTTLAALPALAAFASKESALPLVLALVGWDVILGRRAWREALRRAAPVAAVTMGYAALAAAVTGAPDSRFVRFDPAGALAGYVHLVQALLGLDHPAGLPAALAANGPHPVALAAGLVLALRLPRRNPPAAMDRDPGAAHRFAAAWVLVFGLPLGPVSHTWSSYYATLAAAGAALAVALLAARLGRGGWAALIAGLLWWHAGGTAVRGFSVTEDRWTWTSHLTAAYFERAAALTDTLSRQLRRLVPDPAPHTRFFFATLPPHAGFQMGNGALIRNLYRDPTLRSHFYTELSDSTVGGHPWMLLHWDGAALRPLYHDVPDPLFQIGTDLLLLDRPRGAAAVFRRGMEQGGVREDHLYALGWAELWSGRRDAAEAAWSAWGARDDSVRWHDALRGAQTAWVRGRDSLAAQRLLLEAIRHGIGRPEGHATLGRLLLPRRPKYGVLELKVAAWLDPRDVPTRIALAAALAAARLDGAARRELEAVRALPLAPAADSAARALERRLAPAPSGVVVLEPAR